jgi:triphosphoribosyl-dephospho-CoA synthase
MHLPHHSLSIGQLATLACTLEVTIPKPGNVHRSADFADTCLQDFLTSAIAIGPVMNAAPDRSLGETILDSVKATRAIVFVNTNLGIILLLAPLAKVQAVDRSSISQMLAATDAKDCRAIYEAIRLASPGGIGQSGKHDVHNEKAPDHILDAMQLAAERDLIARQYVSGFEQVLDFVLPAIEENQRQGMPIVDSVVRTHLKTMHQFPDSLIARKCGDDLASESAARAGAVLDSGSWDDRQYLAALEDFDFWLRSDGNRRNPGTTADMIAAALFAGLRLGRLG